MAILNLVKIGTKSLRKESEPITEISDNIIQLVQNMKETMASSEGVGLAAPQVGKNIRLIIYQHPEEMTEPEVMINPQIISHSLSEEIANEGCLSIPEERQDVPRFKKVKVEYQDINGAAQKKRLVDINARIIQHELDHLNGILFVDRVKEEDKIELRKKYGGDNIH